MTDLETAVADMVVSVEAFHERFGIKPLTDRSDVIGYLQSRVSILQEEVGEHCSELNRNNKRKAYEEAADILFVAIGTLAVMEDDGVDVINYVITKNDKKSPRDFGENRYTEKVTKK